MKQFVAFFLLLFSTHVLADDSVIAKVYGSHTAACIQTAVAATGANSMTVTKPGVYEIYGYTSGTDFSGITINCIQGNAGTSVAGIVGTKIPADAHVYWKFSSGASLTISCQTGSGSGYYDVCFLR